MLCQLPIVVQEWEQQAWADNFRRLDELRSELRVLFSKIDTLAAAPATEADTLLRKVRLTLTQKIGIEQLDVTGLRADQPRQCKFEDLFVHPQLTMKINNQKQTINTGNESIYTLVHPHARAVIIGSAGSGKSTWSKWLQRELVGEQKSELPIRIDLRRFSREYPPSLHALIRDRDKVGVHLVEEIDSDCIGRWLKESKVVFILDGFDEIALESRDKVRDWIVDLHSAASTCPILLTSRSLTTDHLDSLGKSWQRWNIEFFDKGRVIDYINRWYQYVPLLQDADREVDANQLAEAWQSDPTIGPLTGNPLLLSTLLMVHHLDGRLPSGRAQLYRRYVEGMLGLWDDRRKVATTSLDLSLEQKRQVLRGLALYMHLQGKDELEESNIVAVITKLLQARQIPLPAVDVLAHLRERSGLLVGPGVYSFVHKSVAEYLVAETVVQGNQKDESGQRIDRFCLFNHRNDDRWNTVIFLWAGLAPVSEIEAFVDECHKSGDWSLAYGILYDQFERISPETQRRYFYYMTEQSFSPAPSGLRHWSFGRPANMENNEIFYPFFELRGLWGTDLSDWLHYFIKKFKISWSEVAGSSNLARDLLWITFAFDPENLDDWKACLASPTPPNDKDKLYNYSKEFPNCQSLCSPEGWRVHSVESVCYKSLLHEYTPQVSAVTAAFREACPSLPNIVPFILMNVVREIKYLIASSLALGQHYKVAPHRLNSLLEEILSVTENNKPIDDDWLRGTTKWHTEPIIEVKAIPTDLLSEFIDALKVLVEAGAFSQSTLYERAIAFAEQLRQRRERLPLISPTATESIQPSPSDTSKTQEKL